MTTIEQRIGSAVASMEYAADIAEKFVDPHHIGGVNTGKGVIKSLSQLSDAAELNIINRVNELSAVANSMIPSIEAGLKDDAEQFTAKADSASALIAQVEADLVVDVDRITAEADAAISRISHFREEVFVAETTYAEDRIYFIDSGIAYTPLVFPYESGLSIVADKVANKLTVLQGLTDSIIGDDIDQLPSNRKVDLNVKHFEGVSAARAAVISSQSRYFRIQNDSYYTKSECVELGIAWPDGGAFECGVVEDDAAVNGVCDFQCGSKKLRFNGTSLDARQFGCADNVPDCTERLLVAADYAFANNIRLITVDKDVHINAVDSSLLSNNRANVMFVGNGRFSDVVSVSSAMYRRQVIPRTSKTALPKSDQNLDVSLKMNPDNGVVRVVFLGDSLSTTTPNVFSPSGTKSVEFQKFITRCNPGIEFEFIQRAIGGKNIGHMDSTPNDPDIASKYPWYTDPNRDWLEYVYDVNPHLIVLASGTNDSNSFEPSTLFSVVNKLEGGTTANIAFITNIGAVLSGLGDRLVNTFGTRSAQEGRDYAAGYYRSFAVENGYPVIDLNRTFNMVRDGRDILSTSAITASTATISNGIMTVGDAEECHDFAMTVEVEAGAFTNIASMSVSLSRVSTNVVFIKDNGNGQLIAIFKDGANSPSNYKTVDLNIPTPVGAFEFRCGVSGSDFFFADKTNYANNGPVITIPCYRFGGLFKPTIMYYNTYAGPVISGTVAIGEPEPNMPQLTDAEMWGVVESSYQDWDIGGNGINHPSSLGAASLYQAHYAQQIMRIKNDRSEISDYEYITLNDDGTVDICGRVVLSGQVSLVELPFAINHPERRATVSNVSGSPYSVSIDGGSSDSTHLAIVGFSLSSGDSAFGFPVVYHIIGGILE